jgi:hypothetical protein
MNIIKKFTVVIVLAILAITTVQAATPTGTAVSAKASGMIVGGSNVALTWAVPAAATYKVWILIPKNSKATNALYRVYPKGSLAGSTVCSSTDATYPCFEIPVNQALNQGKWLQLASNLNSQWSFTKSGYIKVTPNNLAASELFGVAAVIFEKTTAPATLSIGQTYQGGIIFYLDDSKQHGLIAAPTDQSSNIQWYNGSFTSTNVTNTAIGTGSANTAAIVASQGAGTYAASICDNLVIGTYSNWYLPSKDELALMYSNIGPGAAAPLTNVGGFGFSAYWSSSEYDSTLAWIHYFNIGFQYSYDKSDTFSVRAIRSF